MKIVIYYALIGLFGRAAADQRFPLDFAADTTIKHDGNLRTPKKNGKDDQRFAFENDLGKRLIKQKGTPRSLKEIPKDKPSQYIVGGTPVEMPVPYFGFWSIAGCGATLIHDDIVLTAAHVSEGETKQAMPL